VTMAENRAAWRVVICSVKISTLSKKRAYENKHDIDLFRPSCTQLFVVFSYERNAATPRFFALWW
jgi:hypothetical protein